MEHAPQGDLWRFLQGNSPTEYAKPKTPLAWDQQYALATDISLGLAFLHSEHMQHRDIKSPNVLLDSQYRAKLCDFGFSKKKAPEEKSSTGIVGSKPWNAPEVLLEEPHGFPADIYSLGVVLWEITARQLPAIYTGSLRALSKDFDAKQNGMRNAIPSHAPPKLASLLPHCCHMDPQQRPTASQLAAYLRSTATFFTPSASTTPLTTTTAPYYEHSVLSPSVRPS